MIDSRGTYLPFKQPYLKDTLQVGNNVCVIKQGSLPRLRNAITSWTSHFEQVKRYYSTSEIFSHLPICMKLISCILLTWRNDASFQITPLTNVKSRKTENVYFKRCGAKYVDFLNFTVFSITQLYTISFLQAVRVIVLIFSWSGLFLAGN